ncbi:MAG TPA: ferrous iron transporter B [Syntrophomonadaceae bacterium]|nr:ferrous iron transporter B [Syntrophomonadaceae bacterium]HQE23406.1 ferrous iron transporter B [Syntrophomonadaceae bacterium]
MKAILVGNPNVGKSYVFNRLTGSRVFVSNYPGTSVEINRGFFTVGNKSIELLDMPGVYSLNSDTKEAAMLTEVINEFPDLIIQVLDAVNLERNLVLTLELMRANLPMVLLINQVDRAREMGLKIDSQVLSKELGLPVFSFSALTGEGVLDLLEQLAKGVPRSKKVQVVSLETMDCHCEGCDRCASGSILSCEGLDLKLVDQARLLAGKTITRMGQTQMHWLDKVQNWIDQPILGTVLLLVVAYLCFVILLQFINLSEGPISTLLDPVNQLISNAILDLLPAGIIAQVLSKAVPEGIIIPFTIVMPAMLMVSILMALLEDSGILPRYSVALDRVGRMFGLSGQAIIPLTLGLGCRTPAVVATRILPNTTQRFIAITLLSIVVPCAATLGIMASVIAKFNASLPAVVGSLLAAFLGLSFVLGRMNSRQEEFIYELPPLRIPHWQNVGIKVKARFAGFFTEILPLLLVMSIAIRTILESGILQFLEGLGPITHVLFGIPSEAFIAVLLTIFQRYLAPLLLLNLTLTPREATIAITMIVISLPCLPVMVMTIRELGLKALVKIVCMGFLASFLIGIVLNLVLP